MWQTGAKLLRRLRGRFGAVAAKGSSAVYSADLPEGFGARRITMRLSAISLQPRPTLSFSDHVTDEFGRPTDTLLGVLHGGIAISHDLGRRWNLVKVKGREAHHFVHARSIGNSEYLVQSTPSREDADNKPVVDLLVVNEKGEVLAEHPRHGFRWHGCRAVDDARGTLMYAEYPRNKMVEGKRPSPARVFRSRDRGRSWQVVFERPGTEIRHFHFLQARRMVPGEWWLTSGDYPHESHIWISRDDGDNWTDLTSALPPSFELNGTKHDHDVFRLTDLVFSDDEVIWATDDDLVSAIPPGASVFRSVVGPALAPRFVGRGRWHFRSIVDLGDYLVLLSQRSSKSAAKLNAGGPGVYLMRKHPQSGAEAFAHLFDLDVFPTKEQRVGFTFSRASRAAKNGIFFSYRSDQDVFNGGHRMLEWRVDFE